MSNSNTKPLSVLSDGKAHESRSDKPRRRKRRKDRPRVKRPMQGKTIQFETVTPWPHPVDGAMLLDDLVEYFNSYLTLPPYGAEKLALWAIHASVFMAFTHSPRLNVYSPEKGCGKTVTLDVLAAVIPNALRLDHATPATVFRLIDARRSTLLIDEHDTFLPDNKELRGALNSGHRRGGTFPRCVGDDHEVKLFDTYAPIALAGIGELPGTLRDRSIQIRMNRALPGETRKRFDSRHTEGTQQLKRQIVRWGDDNFKCLEAANPDMPKGIYHRQADNLRPLLAIADLAGGRWPDLARQAAMADAGIVDSVDMSSNLSLLAACRNVFELEHADKLLTAGLLEALAALKDRPWETDGIALTDKRLARLLKQFDVTPKDMRVGEYHGKGYERKQFEDVWTRYLPPQNRDTATVLENKASSEVSSRDKGQLSPHDVIEAAPVADQTPNVANNVTGEKDPEIT